MLPVGAFALPYALRGQFGELLYGVFVLPSRRMQFAAIRPPGPASLAGGTPAPGAGVSVARDSRPDGWLNVALLAAGLLAHRSSSSATSAWLYGRTWLSVRSLAPVAVIAGAFMLRVAPARGRRRCRAAPAHSAGALDHGADEPAAIPFRRAHLLLLRRTIRPARDRRRSPGEPDSSAGRARRWWPATTSHSPSGAFTPGPSSATACTTRPTARRSCCACRARPEGDARRPGRCTSA